MLIWSRRTLGLQAAFAALIGLVLLAGVITARAAPVWFALPIVGVLVVMAFAVRKPLRRRRLLARAFPETWRTTLDRRVAFYRKLDDAGRRRFEDDVRVFLAEQRIFALQRGGGVTEQVDDETKLLIGASAATLCHGLPEFEWPTVRDIVVYPRAFDEDYGASGGIAGMVHWQGPILLSRNDLRHGFRKANDGHNVGLHELAHVMDLGTGHADGVPVGLDWVATAPWISVVTDRLKKLRRRQYRHVLRDYAGTDEAEFFAVAVETFFERPHELRTRDAELYAMLVHYFRQDPAENRSPPAAEPAG